MIPDIQAQGSFFPTCIFLNLKGFKINILNGLTLIFYPTFFQPLRHPGIPNFAIDKVITQD